MHKQYLQHGKYIAAGLLAATLGAGAQAATWSDTFIGYRQGSDFREPNNRESVSKNILQLTHSSGYSVGQNFFNLDLLKSDKHDPARGSSSGAMEAYLTYRHQLHLGKLLDRDLSFGPVKEIGLTGGFELNTKNTAFSPQKRLLVIGPTLKMDVPGFWDISLFYGKEKNRCGLGAPACPKSEVSFDPQWIFNTTWGIPFQAGPLPMKFQGFLTHSSKKGKDYANVETKAETLMRTSLMVDVGQMVTGKKNTFWVGVGYEYWKNKFGNYKNAAGVTKPGIDTRATTLQAEWHF